MNPTKRGLRVGEFVDELSRSYPIGRSAFYKLPEAQRPRSVRVGRSTVILETPEEFVARLASEQRVATGEFAVVDRRQDGDLRVVAIFQDLSEAQAALSALRGAGDATANLQIIASVDPLVDQAAP